MNANMNHTLCKQNVITFLCAYFYVLSPRMHDRVLGQINSTCVITFQRNVIKRYSKVFQLLLHPKTLSTTTSSCNILSLCSGKCYTSLFLKFQDTRELRNRWHIPLVLFLSSLRPAKLEFKKARYIEGGTFGIPPTNIGCALKVLNDPFGSY